jgi:hypothetical protein
MRRWLAAAGLPLVVGIALVTPVPAQQVGPSITLDPGSASLGTEVTVDGSGFQPGSYFKVFFGGVGETEVADGTVDSTGRIKVQFGVPAVTPGSYQVIACTEYNPSAPPATQCRERAEATLRVFAPTTTTTPTTTTSPTTTTVPLVTETTVATTTTSSLSLSAVTTSTSPDPPGPSGPGGVVFTTTSTSLQVPSGLLDPGDPPFFPDLKVTGVEVTQGIQDLQNRMPLVAEKKTLVRVYVGIDQPEGSPGGLIGETPDPTVGPEGWSPVDGLLHLHRNGEEHIVYADNAPITAFVEGSNRHEINQSLNFLLPTNWTTSGDVTITAFVWSDHPHTALYIESDPGNNFAQGTVTFHQAEGPPVVVWRLDPVSTSAFSDLGYQSALSTVTLSFQMRHPVDVPNFVVIYTPLGPGPLWSGETPSEEWDFKDAPSEPNDRMKWVYYVSGLSGGVRFIGLIPESTPRAWAGLASTPVAWSIPNETTPAHEAAHIYGVKHATCKDDNDDGIPDELDGGPVDWTYPHGMPFCSIGPIDPAGYYGTNLWTSPYEVYSNDPADSNVRYPWMGYLHPRWTDTYHYCKMAVVYEVPCDPAAIGVPPKVLTPPVNCGPSQGNGFMLDLCIAVEPPNPLLLEVGPIGSIVLAIPDTPTPDWVVVGVDLVNLGLGLATQVPASQALQSDFEFLAERAKTGDISNEIMLRVTDADGHVMVQVPVDTQGSGFEEDGVHADTSTVLGLPWPMGASSLDLLFNGEVVDSRSATSPPTVTIDALGAAGRQVSVSWSGEDPDGDPLLYSVLWSTDGGATWQAVDTGFPDTDALIDADALHLPGGDVLVAVTASDGLTTRRAEAGPVTVPAGSPSGFIVGPEAVPQHSAHELTFQASDPEDGPIKTGTWESDLDGSLGEGRTISTRGLSVGTHSIRVTVTDADGNALELEHELLVEPSDLPAPRPPGAIPEAELIAALGPAGLDGYQPDVDSAAETPTEPADVRAFPWVAVVATLALVTAAFAWRRAKDRSG